ncbi:MAG: hypothetical protein JW797_11995 [Bradymonadales bacterium]|nr:hypothetical protein [Bradymonadales bacterium]
MKKGGLGCDPGQILLLLVALLVGLSAIAGWDLWWHLKTGELAAGRFSSLPFDEFSLTHNGEPWRYKDLGAELLLYLLYRGMGVAGLVLFKVAVAVALMLLLLALARRHLSDFPLITLVAGLAFLVARFRITVRPEAFSLLLFPAFLLIIEFHRRRSTRPGWDRGPLWGLVALQWLWSNLHRGALLGLVLFFGYAIWMWLFAPAKGSAKTPALKGGLQGGKGSRFRPAATVTGFALLATAVTAINPSGVAIFTRSFGVVTSQALSELVSEWEQLSPMEMMQRFPLASAWMVLVAGCLAAMLLWGRLAREHLWELGIAALFVAWGFKAPRMLPYLAMATVPFVGLVLERLVGRRCASISGRLRGLSLLAGTLVLALAAVTGHIGWPRPGWAEHRYPDRAVDLIVGTPIEGEGFVTFTFAGFFIFHAWPHKHVICDGRFDTVYSEETMRECLTAERDPERFERLRRRYSLQWVLAHNRPGPSRQPGHPRAFDYLDVDSRWSLVHWDESALLYLRRDGPGGELARRLGYRFLRPHDPDVSLMEALAEVDRNPELLPALQAEVERLVREAKDDYRVMIVLVLFLDRIGERDSEPWQSAVQRLQAWRDRDTAAIDRVLEYLDNRR